MSCCLHSWETLASAAHAEMSRVGGREGGKRGWHNRGMLWGLRGRTQTVKKRTGKYGGNKLLIRSQWQNDSSRIKAAFSAVSWGWGNATETAPVQSSPVYAFFTLVLDCLCLWSSPNLVDGDRKFAPPSPSSLYPLHWAIWRVLIGWEKARDEVLSPNLPADRHDGPL